MLVHHQVAVLDRRPEPVVVGMVQRREPVLGGRRERKQDAAPQAVLGDPLHVLDRVVDVVQVDEADARAAGGRLATEVGQPAVVRASAGQRALVLLGPTGGAMWNAFA